jgi:hypothetical protein
MNLKKETEKALKNLKPGMRFSEMLSWWVYVLCIHENAVMIRCHSGHPSNPIGETVEYRRLKSPEALKKFIKKNDLYYCDDEAFKRMKEEIMVTTEELCNNFGDVNLEPRWKMSKNE